MVVDKLIIALLCAGIVLIAVAVVIFVKTDCITAVKNMNMLKKNMSEEKTVSAAVKDMYYKKSAGADICSGSPSGDQVQGFVKREVIPAQEDTAFLAADMDQIKKDDDLTQPLQYDPDSTAPLKEETSQDTAEL